MRRFIITVFSLIITFTVTSQAFAASYAIAPFKINGGDGFTYLQTAIPPMFNSRLFLAGVNEPIAKQDQLLTQKPADTEQKASALRTQFGADYLIYGSVTILGQNASLDVSVISDKSTWHKAVQTDINRLFDAVQSISTSINQEVFGRTMPQSQRQTGSAPLNASIIANETHAEVPSSSYLNPDLRYQGTETQRERTKPLNYESYGFEIADFNGDGFEDIAVLSATEINIYRFESSGDLTPLATHKLPTVYAPLRISALKQQGRTYLVFTANENSTNTPAGEIFLMKGNKLERVAKSSYYLTVASVTAYEDPILIGQLGDKTRFLRGSVYRMNFNGSDISRGNPVGTLPKEANIFNFSWLPNPKSTGGDHLIVIDNDDKMLVFDTKGKRLSKSDDYYASTGVGVVVTRDITGFASREASDDLLYQYIPMRVVIADLDDNGQYEAITSKPISAAQILLNNYRNYSQGEVVAQVWDGIGMNLLWKTRRIKGTIVDVALGDPNNDGVLDLVVSVNSYPGTLGVGKIRNTIMLYPLETTNVDTSAINFSE